MKTAPLCHLRSQAHQHATLAMILAERGDADQAASAATEMLDKARGMESHRIRDRVLAVSDAIRARGDTMAARELAERARDQFSVPL